MNGTTRRRAVRAAIHAMRSAVCHDHPEDLETATVCAARALALLGKPKLCARVLLAGHILPVSHCCTPHTLREARSAAARENFRERLTR